jgi:flagellin-like protein
MSNKGVSAVIATIIILLIVLALAGTAYVYFSGILEGKTGMTISIQDASCNGTALTVVLANDGTRAVTDQNLQIVVNNMDVTTDFVTASGSSTYTISPQTSEILVDDAGYSVGNEYTLIVTSPSNTVRQVVRC